jgi:hypothetical protein
MMADRFERYKPEVKNLELRPGFTSPSCAPRENHKDFLEWCRIRLVQIRLFAYYVLTQNVRKLTLWFNVTDDQVCTMRNFSRCFASIPRRCTFMGLQRRMSASV